MCQMYQILSNVGILSHLTVRATTVSRVNIPVLQIRKLRVREVKYLAYYEIANNDRPICTIPFARQLKLTV